VLVLAADDRMTGLELGDPVDCSLYGLLGSIRA